MWAKAPALTLRELQGDIPIKFCNKTYVLNAQGFKPIAIITILPA
jgi:hypothetical protein